MESMDLIKNPLYWREGASAELAGSWIIKVFEGLPN